MSRSMSNPLALVGTAFTLIVAGSAVAWAGGHIKPGQELPRPDLTQEQMDGVRGVIKKFANYTNDELLDMMARLYNEHGRLSSADTRGEVGVLVLAHHFYGEGYEQFKQTFSSVKKKYPTTYGFGLAIAESDHLQAAVDDLENSGAKTIVVIPATTADKSGMVRQWRYALGASDEPGYIDIPQVETDAKIVWAPNPMPHPIVGEALRDHARAASRNPANEMLLIMGHGPADPADNQRELAVLDQHAAFIQKEVGFAEVRVVNVQDDAPIDWRAANVERLRGWVSQAKAQGRDVVVITTVLTAAGVMGKLQRDVEDLGVTFSDTGVMTHPRFPDWLEEAITASVDSAG